MTQKKAANRRAHDSKKALKKQVPRVDESPEDLPLTMIPPDFDVVRIGSGDGLTLFCAERDGLFHFVCHKSGSGLWQYHIPHFRIANAISEASERTEEALQFQLADGLSLLVQKNGPPGLMTGGACFLLNGSSGSALADCMIRSAELLDVARKRVVRKGDVYVVANAKTQAGNGVSSKSRLLMEGIAFERALLRRLSAKQFGLHSAFCTHRDFPCALEKRSCLKELLEAHFEFYDANTAPEDFLEVVMAVQDDFVGCRIWDPGGHMPIKQAIEALSTALSKLDPVQRTQLVLLNGMHGGSVFLHLAVLTGMVTFEDYAQFRTAAYQPDSEDEQWIRSTASYIQLFGDIGRAEQ